MVFTCMKIDKKITRNILESLDEKVVSKRQLISTFRDVLQGEFSESLITNLRRKKEILYVFNGYYYVKDAREIHGSYMQYSPEEMVYALLNKSNVRWYLGLESALERNTLIWQAVVNPVILNSKFSGEKKILGVKFQFRKMKRNLFDFGCLKKTTKNRITYYYSDPQKTYLDFIYHHEKIPTELSEVKNQKKTLTYLSHYSRNFRKKVIAL